MKKKNGLFYIKLMLILVSITSLFSCNTDSIPKPKGYPRLEYAEPKYQVSNLNCPYSFEYSNQAIVSNKKENCWVDIKYPTMKGVIYLTYYPLKNNLQIQIKQTEKMVYDHTIKANSIKPKFYENKENHTFGTMYKLGGEAATNFQFYITDSINHFIAGSVYFRTQPKPDSLQPAIEYIEKDVRHLVETLKWK